MATTEEPPPVVDDNNISEAPFTEVPLPESISWEGNVPKSDPNDPSSPESDKLLIDNDIQAYKSMAERFERKKTQYNWAHHHYSSKNFLYFTIPLLILQILNAIMPSILTSEENADTLKIITTVISSVSAAVIALQSKLRWPEKSEKFNSVASTYGLLASDSWFEMNKAKTYYRVLQEKNETINHQIPTERLLKFLKNAQKLEKHATKNVSVLKQKFLVISKGWVDKIIAQGVKNRMEKNQTVNKKKEEKADVKSAKKYDDAMDTRVNSRRVSIALDWNVREIEKEKVPSLESNSDTDHKKADLTLYQSPTQAYKLLWNRFRQERQFYNYAARIYRSAELQLFFMPLLLLQVCNAVLPTILENDPESARLSTTIIAAISAAIIAAQGKLRFKETAEQFNNISNTYNTLVSDTYFEMTNSQIMKPYFLNEAKGFERLEVFLGQIQRMIDNAKDGCPVPSALVDLSAQIERAENEQKLQNEKDGNSHAVDIGG